MTGPNTSSAVMQQRSEPLDSLDDFPTPPWAGRALAAQVLPEIAGGVVWEPACNRGFLARGLSAARRLILSDIAEYDRWVGPETLLRGRGDFLFAEMPEGGVDWIITKPPFRLADDFVRHALKLGPRKGVAILCRTAFLESQGRYEDLFRHAPPTTFVQFVERVVMLKSRCLSPDVPVPVLDDETGEVTWKTPATATAYCWLIWRTDGTAMPGLVWIPPCRRSLQLPGDYDPVPEVPQAGAGALPLFSEAG